MLIWIRADRAPDWYAATARLSEIAAAAEDGRAHSTAIAARYDLPEQGAELKEDLRQGVAALRALHEMRHGEWPSGTEGRYRVGPYWVWVVPDGLSDNDDHQPFETLRACDVGEYAGFWQE